MSSKRFRAGLLAVATSALGLSGAGPAPAAPRAAAAEPSPTVAEQAADQGLRAEIEHLVDRFGTRLRHGPGSTSSHRTYRPKDGTYVESDGAVFRIAGGAPIHVGTWKAMGGEKRVEYISERQFEDLRLWPRDGTFVTATDGRSYRFVGGAPLYISTWTPFDRPHPGVRIDAAAIAHAGDDGDWSAVNPYPLDLDPDDIDSFLDDEEEDDTIRLNLDSILYVRGAQSRRIYKLVGGAPLYVSDWAAVGGPKPAVTVDQFAINRAGGRGPWRFLAKYPFLARYVQARGGQVFSVAGSGIVYVSNPKLIRDTVVDDQGSLTFEVIPAVVDQKVLDRAGGAPPYDNLLFTPRDGTVLLGQTSWFGSKGDEEPNFYYVQGGVPTLIPPDAEEDDLPGPVTGFGSADQIAIDRAGQPGVWSHLKSPG